MIFRQFLDSTLLYSIRKCSILLFYSVLSHVTQVLGDQLRVPLADGRVGEGRLRGVGPLRVGAVHLALRPGGARDESQPAARSNFR